MAWLYKQALKNIEKDMGYLNLNQVTKLRSLDNISLKYIENFISLDEPIYNKFIKKLLTATPKNQKGLRQLENSELKSLLSNLDTILKTDKNTLDTFVKILSAQDISLHTLVPFFKNCRTKINCNDLSELIKKRLTSKTISEEELILFKQSPGPYMEYYLPIAEKEPLGRHLGKGGFGSVFLQKKTERLPRSNQNTIRVSLSLYTRDRN